MTGERAGSEGDAASLGIRPDVVEQKFQRRNAPPTQAAGGGTGGVAGLAGWLGFNG